MCVCVSVNVFKCVCVCGDGGGGGGVGSTILKTEKEKFYQKISYNRCEMEVMLPL